MSIWYRAGTVAVTLNNPVVTGTLTTWLSQARAGDTINLPDGKGYEVLTVDSNTQITLATNYLGATSSGGAHEIKPYSPLRSAVAALSYQISNFLATVIGITGGAAAPNNADGLGDGSYYFRIDPVGGIAEVYRKSAGAYTLSASLTGPAGPIGPGSTTTSASSIAISIGVKVFTIPGTAGASYMGLRMRAARTSDPTKYLEGIVTATTANTITITADVISAGTGTFADWSIGVAGNVGLQGPIGAPSVGTSTTSILIGTGTKTFTVAAGLDLAVGQRVRFADAANPAVNYVEGPITAYSGTSLSISSDTVGGAGTIASWSFGIIGSRGLTGATGAASTVPGPTGPSYAASSTTSLSIGTGNKSLTTQTDLAYLAGSRVRLANQAAPSADYMDGECTAYNNGTGAMSVAVDFFVGTGTFAAWNLSVAGERGPAGTNGTAFSHQGTYSSGTNYSYGQTVRNGGALWTYINAAASTGNAPPTLPTTSNAYWELSAQDGTNGTGLVNSVNSIGPTSGDVALTALNVPISALAPANYSPAGSSVEQHLAGVDGALKRFGDNLLHNADGVINQRGATSVADDTYFVDRWYALTQTAAIGVGQLFDVADGIPNMIRLTQSQAAAQRMGAAQIVEAATSHLQRGNTLTVSGTLRCSVATTLRYAVLEWTGTDDTPTSDVVLNWTSATFTTGNFFNSTTLVVAGTGSVAVGAATLTDFAASVNVSSACKNLIVMVWSDGALAQTTTLDFRAKLEVGAVATAWDRPTMQVMTSDCLRFFQRVTFSNNGSLLGYRVGTAFAYGFGVNMLAQMLGVPTVTHSSPTFSATAPGATNQIAMLNTSGGNMTITGALTVTIALATTQTRALLLQAGTSFSGTAGDFIRLQVGTGVYIDFSCDL